MMDDWVEIKEFGNPTIEKDYLILTNNGGMLVARWCGLSVTHVIDFPLWINKCVCSLIDHDSITHWMPLPDMPEEEI